MAGVKTYEPFSTAKSFRCKDHTCGHHEQSEVLSGHGNLSRPFSGKHAVSLPRHLCDERRHSAARNQTLRENAEFVYKTGDHQSPAARQRFQGVSNDILGPLINEAKLSIPIFRFLVVAIPAVAICKNPARAERDHTNSA